MFQPTKFEGKTRSFQDKPSSGGRAVVKVEAVVNYTTRGVKPPLGRNLDIRRRDDTMSPGGMNCFGTLRCNISQQWINNMTYYLPPPRHLCSPSPTFILLVLSSPQHYEARQAIRDTWGGVTKVSLTSVSARVTLRVGFLVGRLYNENLQEKIKSEHNLHGDIIQADYADSYKNITYKSVLALKFASEFCSNSNFLVKVDDDVFLNVYRLVNIAPYGKRKLIGGSLIRRSKVKRNGKWTVSREELIDKTYPDYANGPAYIVTMDSVTTLYELAMKTDFFVIDDVWITGYLRMRANITLASTFGKYMGPSQRFKLKKACYVKGSLGYHRVSPVNQRAVWKHLEESRTAVAPLLCPFKNVTLM